MNSKYFVMLFFLGICNFDITLLIKHFFSYFFDSKLCADVNKNYWMVLISFDVLMIFSFNDCNSIYLGVKTRFELWMKSGNFFEKQKKYLKKGNSFDSILLILNFSFLSKNFLTNLTSVIDSNELKQKLRCLLILLLSNFFLIRIKLFSRLFINVFLVYEDAFIEYLIVFVLVNFMPGFCNFYETL